MKIGFLAMSGLRAHDPDLLRLGLTLPGVIERGNVVGSLPSLGLLYLAAVTPSGHELKYFEANGDGDEPEEIYQCDLVAISTLSAQIFEAYAIADRLRAVGVKVAMGGLHVSVRPEEAAQHADFVFIGEGEPTWPEAVRAIEAGNARQFWNANELPAVDVRQLPVPRYDLLLNRGERADNPHYTRFTVQTTRGCPWRCDFCASNVMLGRAYRRRPVERVRADIEALMRLQKKPFIEFADDNTFVDKAWGKELCLQLIPLRIHWMTETDISVADDPELLALMRRSGCRQLLIGLESPEQTALEGIELRTNFKAHRFATCRDAVRRIQEHGITVNGCFILGLDGHTPDIFQKILNFVDEVALYEVQITVLTPFPGTPLYDRLLREGRLIQPERWDLCTLFDVNFVPKGMTPTELRRGVYWLAEQLYNEDRVAARRRRYFEALWNRSADDRAEIVARAI
jgi:radical SAM superfamily enzyme YgiQ (UPF0313 family)